MVTINYEVKDSAGIHIRPAARIAQVCTEFKSEVIISNGSETAHANNVLKILDLSAKKGDVLTISAEGEDEKEAVKKIEEILNEVLDQNEKNKNLLKIAFFGTKSYDKLFFSELSKDQGEGTYNVDIKYFRSRLTEETVSNAKGCDAVCIFVNDEAPANVVEALAKYGVKLILLRCAGFNNVDLKTAKKCGITVLRVPAYSPYAVAEHAMAILQAANRRLCKAYNKVRDNNFALSGLLGIDLHNKVAGIMGTGKIGVCMARICKGYGMTVLGWDAYPNQALVDEGLLTYVTKEELLKRADLISLHAPLIKGEGGTYHLINKEAISMMKDNVMLVNTSRGPIIDNDALIWGLRQDKFHAVALDVYEGEDDNVYNDRSDDMLSHSIVARLTMYPNVILTSHQAFFTREALQAIAATTMENARNYNEHLSYGLAEVKYKE